MEDSIKVYSSPGCPKCAMLKKELDSRNIKYSVEEEDYTALRERGLLQLPILQIGDEFMRLPEAFRWAKSQGGK